MGIEIGKIIKNVFGGREAEVPRSYAETVGRKFGENLYTQFHNAHKDNPEIKDDDLRAISKKAGDVIAALGDDRVRMLVEQVKTTNAPIINTRLSVGEHAGDFLLIHDYDMAGDIDVKDMRHSGHMQLLREGESMAEVGIVELARRVPQYVLPTTPLTFDCVSGNLKFTLNIDGMQTKTA